MLLIALQLLIPCNHPINKSISSDVYYLQEILLVFLDLFLDIPKCQGSW